MHIIQELIDKFEYTVKMLCDKKMLLKMKGTYVVHLTKGWYLSYTEKSSQQEKDELTSEGHWKLKEMEVQKKCGA